ncbi:HAD family hydrolase [Bremerella cremea]|uniref:phosphoglycolate phosphatase n=1 Tax=Bremerella cremea TaxID=1031537 RepID=A0A368KJS6_9BACT|nr:HAD family hydrolase [Bremerella cremea]RCS41017.1 HAD family hydrolase [Bremerella cremea]
MKVCLFDIDGTLINTGKAGKDAMVAAFLQAAELTQIEHDLHLSGKTDRGIFGELFEQHGKSVSEENWQHFIDLYLAGLEKNLPLRQGTVLPGVTPLLAQLSERDDVLLGLLTGNVARGAELKLTHYGINHYFSFGGFGDVHAHRNNVAQAALEAALTHHGQAISPRDVYVIGDTPNDIICAQAIGAQSIAVATGVFSVEQLRQHSPDLLVSDLADLKSISSFILN